MGQRDHRRELDVEQPRLQPVQVGERLLQLQQLVERLAGLRVSDEELVQLLQKLALPLGLVVAWCLIEVDR